MEHQKAPKHIGTKVNIQKNQELVKVEVGSGSCPSFKFLEYITINLKGVPAPKPINKHVVAPINPLMIIGLNSFKQTGAKKRDKPAETPQMNLPRLKIIMFGDMEVRTRV